MLASLWGAFSYGNMVKPYGSPKYGQGRFWIQTNGSSRVIFSKITFRIYTSPLDDSESNWRRVELDMNIESPLPDQIIIQLPWEVSDFWGSPEVNASYTVYDTTRISIEPHSSIQFNFLWDVMTRTTYDTSEMNVDLVPWFNSSEVSVWHLDFEVAPPPHSTVDFGQTFPPPSHITKDLVFLWSFPQQKLEDREESGESLSLGFVFPNRRIEKENLIFVSGIFLGFGVSLSVSSFAELAKWVAGNPQTMDSLKCHLRKLATLRKRKTNA